MIVKKKIEPNKLSPIEYKKQQYKSCKGLFFVFFFISTIFFLTFPKWPELRGNFLVREQNWMRTYGQIIELRKSTTRSKNTTSHSVKLKYTFQAEVKQWTGELIDFHHSYSIEEQDEVYSKYSHQRNVVVFYEKNNPSLAVLDYSYRSFGLMLYIIFIIMAILLPLLSLYKFLSLRRELSLLG